MCKINTIFVKRALYKSGIKFVGKERIGQLPKKGLEDGGGDFDVAEVLVLFDVLHVLVHLFLDLVLDALIGCRPVYPVAVRLELAFDDRAANGDDRGQVVHQGAVFERHAERLASPPMNRRSRSRRRQFRVWLSAVF